MPGDTGIADFRKLATLIRSELHIDPTTLSEEEFIERSRDVMWLLEYREARTQQAISTTITTAIINAYIEIHKVSNPNE